MTNLDSILKNRDRKRQLTPVPLPRKSHGWGSLVSMGYLKESELSKFTFINKLQFSNSKKKKRETLTTKVHLVKAMVFPVVMYGCESWTIKKAECRRIDAFELWCWRRLWRVPWTARRSNESILKEISPEYSLEGLLLKLKLPIL